MRDIITTKSGALNDIKDVDGINSRGRLYKWTLTQGDIVKNNDKRYVIRGGELVIFSDGRVELTSCDLQIAEDKDIQKALDTNAILFDVEDLGILDSVIDTDLEDYS